jgi:hypothetical protein
MRDTSSKDLSGAAALLDTEQAARFLGLAVRTMQNWRVRGEGPAFLRVGRSVKYAPHEIAIWLNSRRFRSTSEADQRSAA